MEELKGLILSGGSGTRMRPITQSSAKQLLPVANKPVLFYGIEALVEAGVTEIAMIIDPETGRGVRKAVGDGSRFNARVTYIEQDQPRGLADALLAAEDFIGNAAFVMYLGDNLLQEGIVELVSSYRASEPDALMFLTRIDNPTAYGVTFTGSEIENSIVLAGAKIHDRRPRIGASLLGSGASLA